MKKNSSIRKMDRLISKIEDKGLCCNNDVWIPTRGMIKILVDNAENLGIKINKSYESIEPEDIAPVFDKMNTWMDEVIKLRQENDALIQENKLLKKKK